MNSVVCVSCGGGLPGPFALCPRCTAPTAQTAHDDPWGAPRGGATYLRRLVVPETQPEQPVAISATLTTVAMVLTVGVLVMTLVSLFPNFATVGASPVALANDRSAALALVATTVVAVLGVFAARAASGWGIGLMAGASANVLLLFQRISAGALGDGTAQVRWGLGFLLLAIAAACAFAVLLIALTGVRTGQRVTQIPSIVAVPVLALIVAAIVIDRENLIEVAYGLAAPARALTASALFLQGVVWVSALATRSRLGVGMLAGTAVAWIIIAVDGAQPARGLLATAGMAQPAGVAAVGGLIVLAAAMMGVCAWPEDHPVRRSLTQVNEAAGLS